MSEEQRESGQKLLRGTILLDRVQMVGEGVVPKELFQGLNREQMTIWLTEPDPEKFPPEMEKLAAFLKQ